MSNQLDLNRALTVARRAAAAAADILLDFRGRFSVMEKAPRDVVTEADLTAQKEIGRIILAEFSDHLFVGEESGKDSTPAAVTSGDPHPPIWIVDPLDGTVNYVHGLQSFAVSIALYQEGEIQLGLIHDPICQGVYWAVKGEGAFLNDRQIKSSEAMDLPSALLACSFSANASIEGDEFQRFARILPHARAVRRLGSAALNMCYVAAGNLDGYWASSVKPWDVAAGAIIAQEAGAVIAGIDSGEVFDPWDPKMVVAGTPELLGEIRTKLKS